MERGGTVGGTLMLPPRPASLCAVGGGQGRGRGRESRHVHHITDSPVAYTHFSLFLCLLPLRGSVVIKGVAVGVNRGRGIVGVVVVFESYVRLVVFCRENACMDS